MMLKPDRNDSVMSTTEFARHWRHVGRCTLSPRFALAPIRMRCSSDDAPGRPSDDVGSLFWWPINWRIGARLKGDGRRADDEG